MSQLPVEHTEPGCTSKRSAGVLPSMNAALTHTAQASLPTMHILLMIFTDGCCLFHTATQPKWSSRAHASTDQAYSHGCIYTLIGCHGVGLSIH